LFTITSNPWACNWLTVWEASGAPDGAAPAAPANPKAAVAIAPAAMAGKTKDFIVLPFEAAFLTAVCRCPSFVTAATSDGFRSQSVASRTAGAVLDRLGTPTTVALRLARASGQLNSCQRINERSPQLLDEFAPALISQLAVMTAELPSATKGFLERDSFAVHDMSGKAGIT
jgi:hypothetical protein